MTENPENLHMLSLYWHIFFPEGFDNFHANQDTLMTSLCGIKIDNVNTQFTGTETGDILAATETIFISWYIMDFLRAEAAGYLIRYPAAYHTLTLGRLICASICL